jgi:hypothetical protein
MGDCKRRCPFPPVLAAQADGVAMSPGAGALLSFLQGAAAGWAVIQLYLARRYGWTLWDGPSL